MNGWTELTQEKLATKDGINELNRMLRQLHENSSSDGETVRVYRGNGVPTISAGNGSLYLRTDNGKLYVLESGTWVIK
jgi:hypothetical protein